MYCCRRLGRMARIWLLCGLRGPFGELLPGIYGDEKGKNTTLFLYGSVCSCVCVCVCVCRRGGYFPKAQKRRCWYPPSQYFFAFSFAAVVVLPLFVRVPSRQPEQQKNKKGPLVRSQTFGGEKKHLSHQHATRRQHPSPCRSRATVKTVRIS